MRLLVNGRPPVLTPAIPKIVLMPDMIARALRNRRSKLNAALDNFDIQHASGSASRPSDLPGGQAPGSEDERSDEGTYWADRDEAGAVLEDDDFGAWEDTELEIGDEDDYRHEVDAIIADPSNVNTAAPSVPSETGPRSPLPKYLFCPAPQRTTVIRIATKHGCQHPLLPERHGEPRSAEDIYRDAVGEMYRHCKSNNLCEVWAYLWNSWYCRPCWKLWARSAYPASIPRKRTTMMVEALWRNIKRLVLHMYNQPPIDLTLYAVVSKALPPYRRTLKAIIKNPRAGRAAKLTNSQKVFK